MSIIFITSEKENFKVRTTGGAKIRSQNKLTSLFMVRFSKKVGYPTFLFLLVKLYCEISKMALFLTYLLRDHAATYLHIWGTGNFAHVFLALG